MDTITDRDFRTAFPTIRSTKLHTLGGRVPNERESRFTERMGLKIAEHGLDFRKLSLEELMGAIFAVSRCSKAQGGETLADAALKIKNDMQRHLISNFQPLLKILVKVFNKVDTIEVNYSVWGTHIPVDLVRTWGIRIHR